MRASLNVILEIVRKEFYQIRQDRRMLFVSLVAPMIQVILLGYVATTDIRYSNLVVCDLDRTDESRELVKRFTNSSYFVERVAVEHPGDIDSFIEAGRASVALVIPAGFGSKILGRATPQVQIVLDGTDANSANVLLGYASQIIGTYSQSILASSSVIPGAGRIGSIVAEPRVWFNPDLKSSNFMVPGVVALVLMIITQTLTSLGIVKEKELGTLEQLMVTPIRPYQLILGKLLPFVVIGFIDMTIVLAIARFWFNVPLLGSVLLLFALSSLFILNTLGLGIFISTISKSQQQAMLIAQFFFFMPFIYLSGFAFPISNMPVVIQYVSYLMPLRYFLVILRGIFLKGAGFAELWPQALGLFVIGTFILVLSVLRFHKKLE